MPAPSSNQTTESTSLSHSVSSSNSSYQTMGSINQNPRKISFREKVENIASASFEDAQIACSVITPWAVWNGIIQGKGCSWTGTPFNRLREGARWTHPSDESDEKNPSPLLPERLECCDGLACLPKLGCDVSSVGTGLSAGALVCLFSCIGRSTLAACPGCNKICCCCKPQEAAENSVLSASPSQQLMI